MRGREREKREEEGGRRGRDEWASHEWLVTKLLGELFMACWHFCVHLMSKGY